MIPTAELIERASGYPYFGRCGATLLRSNNGFKPFAPERSLDSFAIPEVFLMNWKIDGRLSTQPHKLRPTQVIADRMPFTRLSSVVVVAVAVKQFQFSPLEQTITGMLRSLYMRVGG